MTTTTLTPEQQRRGMRDAILAQCFGSPATVAFINGLMLLYFRARGTDGARILLYLALPMVFRGGSAIPLAWVADRIGKKRVGYAGLALSTISVFLLTLSGFSIGLAGEALVVAGSVLFGLGNGGFVAGWFSLLARIVPEDERGRFFGRLRTAWQTSAILFTGACVLFLQKDTPLYIFQIVLAVLGTGQVGRIVFYLRLPEVPEETAAAPGRPLAAMGDILRRTRYMSFCAYVFLLSLFAFNCPNLFGLVEKEVLDFGDDLVALLGNLAMVGSVLGFFLGGKAVDRFGTKALFLFCHLSFGVAVFLFLGRGVLPIPPSWTAGGVNLVFGLLAAASSIAISTEMLALAPEENRSLATSICIGMMEGAKAVGGMACAWALDLGVLTPRWTLEGLVLSAYDTLLLGCAVMILLLVVTLTLVPSVVNRAAWFPRGP